MKRTLRTHENEATSILFLTRLSFINRTDNQKTIIRHKTYIQLIKETNLPTKNNEMINLENTSAPSETKKKL